MSNHSFKAEQASVPSITHTHKEKKIKEIAQNHESQISWNACLGLLQCDKWLLTALKTSLSAI